MSSPRTAALALAWIASLSGNTAWAEEPEAAPTASSAPTERAAPEPAAPASELAPADVPAEVAAPLASGAAAEPDATKAAVPTKPVAREAKPLISVEKEGYLSLRGTLGKTFRHDEGYDLFTADDALSSAGGGVGVDVFRWEHLLAVAVDLDVMHEYTRSQGILGGSFTTRYEHYATSAGATLRVRTFDWFAPYLRGFFALGLTQTRLKDVALKDLYPSDWEPSLGGGFAVGTALRTPSVSARERKFPALSAGVRLEAGYQWLGAQEITLEGKRGGSHPIPIEAASLGSLDQSAGFIRASLELRL